MKLSTTCAIRILLLATTISFSACAGKSKPMLYPNQYLQDVGPVQADVDLQYCLTLADNYVKEPSKYQELAKKGVLSGAIGAGTGALAGVIVGSNVGRSTGAGAAVGAIVVIANELMTEGDHSPTYKNFVDHCLSKKGYEVTGWE